jgi:hypothetical protein
METPELPEQVPEMPESSGGFPVQPAEAEGPLPPPRPVKMSAWTIGLNATAITAALAGGLFILTGMPGRTLGATRSCHLKYEQRQQQIEATVRADNQSPERERGVGPSHSEALKEGGSRN